MMNKLSRKSIKLIWQGLIAPNKVLIDIIERRRAKLLLSIMLAFCSLNLPIFIISQIYLYQQGKYFWVNPSGFSWFITTILSFLIYVMSRGKYYQSAALLFTSWLMLSTSISIFTGGDPDAVIGYLITVIIASILFDFRSASIFAGVGILLTILEVIYFPPSNLANPIVTVIASALTLVFVNFRNQVEKDRQGELSEVNRILASERNRLQTLIDAIPDYIFVKDNEGRFVISNKAHTAATNLTSSNELVGKLANEVFPQSIASQFHLDDEQVLNTEQALISQERITVGEDGRSSWVLTTKIPLYDANQELMGLVGISRDITERKEAEQALYTSEQKYRNLIEAMGEGFGILDKNGLVTYVNERFCDMTNFSYEELVGQAVLNLVDEDNRQILLKNLSINSKGEGKSYELAWAAKDGTNIPTITSPRTIFDINGNFVTSFAVVTDIRQQKKAEEALRESEAKLKRSQAVVHMGDWTWDINTNTLKWSEEMYRIFGLNSEDISDDLTTVFAQIIHPDDRAKINQSSKLIRAGARSEPFEYRIIRSDGTVRWIWTQQGETRFDQNGEISQLSGIAQDITERKEAGKALANERNLLRTIMDTAVDFIYVKDTKGRHLLSNLAQARSLGKASIDEIIGKTNAEIHSPEVAARYYADEQAIIQSGQSMINKEEFRLNEIGQGLWLSTTKVPLRNNAGEIIGIVGISRNITERRRAEDSLKQQQELLQQMMDHNPNVVIVKDYQGRFVYANHAAEKEFGLRVDEMIGKTDLDIHLVASEAEAFMRDDREVLETLHSKFILEEPVTYANGELHWHQSAKIPLVTPDGQRYIMAVGANITERKQMETTKARLFAELETKNAELEQFTYTVSHDLKSPIITIKGFLGYLEKDALKGNVATMKKDIIFISDAVDKMYQLLDELLELSRIGRVINPPEQISLEAIVNEALDLISNIDERNFSLKIMPNLPAIYADRVRIREVFENLVSNAVKYKGDQPEPRIEIGVREDHGETVFYVQDHGIGIEPKYHDNVFGLFNQLDQTIEGTGIGLTIVKRIIEAHNGRIWVESDGKDMGSTFCFTLPKIVPDSVQS